MQPKNRHVVFNYNNTADKIESVTIIRDTGARTYPTERKVGKLPIGWTFFDWHWRILRQDDTLDHAGAAIFSDRV